jgi:hypothetical protein
VALTAGSSRSGSAAGQSFSASADGSRVCRRQWMDSEVSAAVLDLAGTNARREPSRSSGRLRSSLASEGADDEHRAVLLPARRRPRRGCRNRKRRRARGAGHWPASPETAHAITRTDVPSVGRKRCRDCDSIAADVLASLRKCHHDDVQMAARQGEPSSETLTRVLHSSQDQNKT